MYNQNHNLQIYIDNHEEIWKRNAEIDKAVERKQAAQEALDLIMHLTCNLALEFGKEEYKAIAAHFGLSGEVKRVEPQREYLKQFAEYLKDYARQCKEVGYDGIGENDIDEKLEEFLK